MYKGKKMNEQIEKSFTYHPPTPAQAEYYVQIRGQAKEFAYTIENLCPNSREKSLALTNLDQVVMWANASIARNS